ncbi:MAG: mannose-6-phosphate isomerase, class I, partial [bacterium]|nr:mannose-6-phosphate isomerase, class I [bacterium]
MHVRKIFKMENIIQDYAWGTSNVLQALFGIENKGNKPQAEIWMGAHPKAPSTVLFNSTKIPLHEFILQNPAVLLGSDVSKGFDNKLPFLFKLLSAGKPLSIQAHPTLEQAKFGFEKENRAGIALSAPNRNYEDDNHKPELICAITPFKALNGFRDINELITLMMKLDIPSLKESLDAFRKEPDKKGLKDFYSRLMRLDALKKETVV